MKKVYLLVLVTAFVFGSLGAIISFMVTQQKCNQEIEHFNTIENLKLKLLLAEDERITEQLELSNTKLYNKYDGFFSLNYRHYFQAKISNKALIAKAKDVKIKIILYSKTKAVIGTKEFIIYEFINPQHSLTIEEELQYDEDTVDSYSARIVSAKYE